MKKKLLAVGLTLIASGAIASEERPSVEAFLGIDKTDWDQARNLKDDHGVDFGAGLDIHKNWAIEGWYARTETEQRTANAKTLVETASVNALRYLAEGQTRPFVSFGASHLMLNPDNGPSIDDSSLDFGLGLKHYFKNNAVIRGDVIARIFEDETTSDDFNVDPTFRLSVGYAFGKSSTPTKSMPIQASEPVTPKEAPPAPIDSDGDGIFDANDNCPNTDSGLKVDDKGCKIILSETVNIDLNINFPNNSNEISESYSQEIKQVSDFMKQYDGTIVEVKGYTDDRGSASYNQQLSERRAQAVADMLVNKFGIEKSRVSAVGFGENNPVADNNTAEGRALNRRVVAEISTEVQKTITK